ncbi:glycosyltransferase family 2 protein [uncultured Bacteroides sp.]|uniref:glycosyltransferase family 2 protein n=1 Tax=uncultured Bacteroides sp. TaxID=162156 RepID=UPI00280B7DA5|nr:glycosyltransferase family 2 protein [uncultured Bacteroides sp.]
MPKISVITVCYNASTTIQETIESVLGQDYSDYEYIIIDGKSSDNTLEVINTYKSNAIKLISEPDSGVYDAMNKGLKIASGDWIYYLNAGDVLCSDSIFTKVSFYFKNDIDVIYGNIILKYKNKSTLAKPLSLDYFPIQFPIFHPGTFVRSGVIKGYGFDLSYKIAADYNLFYKLYQDLRTFYYIDLNIAIFEAETGLSSSNRVDLFVECQRINKRDTFFMFVLKKNVLRFYLLMSKLKIFFSSLFKI